MEQEYKEDSMMEEAKEKEQAYITENEFDEQVELLYQSALAAHCFSAEDKLRLQTLLTTPKEVMDLTNYIHIMFLSGKLYEAEGNKNGARYCAMRMLWMKECLTHPRKKRPRYLQFQGYEWQDQELAMIHTYTDFLNDVYRDINKKLFILTAGLFVIAMVILALFLKINLLVAILESFLLGGINFLLQKRRMPAVFQKNQTEASGKYIDDALADFDRVYRYL